MKLKNLIKEFIPGKDMEGNSEQESVNEGMSKQKIEDMIWSLENEIKSWHPSSDSKKKKEIDRLKKKLSKFESVTESSSDEKLYKDLLKQRARAVRKGQTTLVNSLHKEIEKLVQTTRKNKSVNKVKAYDLHMLADTPGTGTAEEFLKNNPNIDLDLVAVAIQQGTINKYELRDIVKGEAEPSQVEKFMKQFVKESINEGIPSDMIKSIAGNLAKQGKVKIFMQGKTSTHDTLMNLLNTLPLAKMLKDDDKEKVVKYAMEKFLKHESVTEDHDTFKLEKLKAKALVLKKKIMPEKVAKRSLLGTIMSEIKTDRKL